MGSAPSASPTSAPSTPPTKKQKKKSIQQREEKLWCINLSAIHCCDKFCLDASLLLSQLFSLRSYNCSRCFIKGKFVIINLSAIHCCDKFCLDASILLIQLFST